MSAAYVAVAVLTANAYVAMLDFTCADSAVSNATRVGAPPWLFPLDLLKLAGAVGLLVGIRVPALGIAAATGLVLFFPGAVAAHVRVRWYVTNPFPAAFLGLALAALVLRLGAG